MIQPVSFQPFGEHAVLINWTSAIDVDVHADIVAFDRLLLSKHSNEIEETVISYHSLAIYLSHDVDPKDFIETIKPIFKERRTGNRDEASFLIQVPVCYEPEFAPDLKQVADIHGMSVDEVIDLHTTPTYKVYFLGFLPGFPYLGGLNPKLHTPRRPNPRPKVEQGAVGIGGEQTGIYTMDSPGGWNIIGRSPLFFFDPKKDPPSVVAAGDYVQFVSISKEEFLHTRFLLEKDIYLPNKKPYHD